MTTLGTSLQASTGVLVFERYLRWGSVVAAVALAWVTGVITDQFAFFGFTLVLLGYGTSEVWDYCRSNRTRWASPVVIASPVLFMIPFGLTNFLYLLPESEWAFLYPGSLDYADLARVELMALAGFAALWLGYRSGLGKGVGDMLSRSRTVNGLLRRSYSPSLVTLVLCMVVSVTSRVALVGMGLYGYSTEAEQIIATAGVAQWVRVGASLGAVALAILSLAYYGTRRRYLGLVLGLWLGHEMVWGVLAAFKASVILPVVIVGVCRFVVERRVPRGYLIAALAVIVPAYAVVEPLRFLRFADPEYDTRSVAAIADAAVGVARGTDERAAQFRRQVSLPIIIASRLHLTTFAARAIEFRDSGPLPADAPPFLRNLLLSPLYAVVPRALMPTKGTATTGAWFSSAVLGWSHRTSVGMSPVAFLYMAGGFVAIVLGFMALGFLQRLSFEWLMRPGGGALLVYLVALAITANVDPSEFWAVFTSYIRYVPLALLAQALAFRR